jgi:hypothetical protein
MPVSCLWLLGNNGSISIDNLGLLDLLGHISTFSLTRNGLDNDTGDLVWVGVRCWATILKISLALFGASAVDADRGTTVGNTP